jgi:predicted extracellular nuclease
LARYGQVTLAAERQFIPTNYIDPNDVQADGVSFDGDKNVSQIRSAEATHRRLRFVLDDGSNDQNPHQVFLQPDPEQGVKSLRVGSHIADLTGIVTVVDGQLQLLPVGTLSVHYEPRPPRAQIGQGNVTVASFNVLNFFTTIDDGRNGARGADSAVELDRQRQKLVAALLELDADIVGLMELENNQASEQDLVIALNNRLGSDQYSGSGLPAQFSTAPGGGPGGGNPIRVGIIYRHTRVQPVGPSGVVIDKAFSNARAPIVQTFQPVGGGSNLTVIVNHFKSKSPQEARGLDVDQRDGQAAFNDSRRRQSAALLHHMDQLRESGQAEHILIIGDLNAYSQEDPIDLLRSGGMIDLLQKFAGDQQPFSYVYKGQAGCLDHALATPELASLATGAAVWHINASEPRHTSYNVEFQPAGSYRGDAFRSSDHDPILIGFRL